MLLAAGRGERMEPLSGVVAKPALEVLGSPLLASAYAHLEAVGCDRIVVNLHRHPRQVALAARMTARRVRPVFSWEPVLLGGAGGVAAARRWFGPGPALVANADIWADLDLSPLSSPTKPDEIVLAVMSHPDPARWNTIVCSRDGWVAAIVPAGGAAPTGGLHFTGFQMLGEKVVAELLTEPADMRAVWERARSDGRLRAVTVEGRWREAGTPAAYRELVIDLLGNQSWCHPSASVGEGAVTRRSAIGAGCSVAAGAMLETCVVTSGARVGVGATLARCVVAGGVTVPAGSAHVESLIVPDGRVPLAVPHRVIT
jgi:NDP-sugar pyrophosphorylase family protein